MKYIQFFDSHSDYEEYISGETQDVASVSVCIAENDIHYNVKPEHDYSKDYFTIKSLEDNNTIYLSGPTGIITNISASTDNGETWVEYVPKTTGSGTTIATLAKDEKLLVKGNNLRYSNGANNIQFKASGEFDVQGNIMSLVSGDSFAEADELSGMFAFRGLFDGCNEIISAKNLILPAMIINEECYSSMFKNCKNLTSAPELPALSLAPYCYVSMFSGCKKLVECPSVLPGVSLANGCYQNMFFDCKDMTKTPELPATELEESCYSHMFDLCIGLLTPPELPATNLAPYCYEGMFFSCSGLTVAPELPATELQEWCYKDMFTQCNSLIETPELPATELATGCYSGMFAEASGLTTVTELPAPILVVKCYDQMFNYCTNINYVKCLAINVSAQDSTRQWLQSVSNSGTFVKDPSMTSWPSGANGIPTGWNVEDAS